MTGFFNIVRVHNHGAAFSFLAGEDGWQRWFFAAIAVVAATWLTWMLRQHPTQRLISISLSCILGGALGNLIDRMAYGYVVDFLDFHAPLLDGLFLQWPLSRVQRCGQRHNHWRNSVNL